MSTDIDRMVGPSAPARVTQTTAVEQSRAVAEVQAAVVVAQQCPRDATKALDEMRTSCRTKGLAERAFYSVPNRGSGPSVHLARELARIWGNVQYGVKELSRDDAAGMSEVLAFAWDVQTNTRSERTFQVPHERMKGRDRQKLTDLGDIYLMNQNVGARAVRECIFTILPPWLVEEAQDVCHATLRDGGGKPLAQRVSEAVGAFDRIGVSVERLERTVGRPSARWTDGDVARLGIDFRSVERGEVDAGELFPDAVSAADLAPVKARRGGRGSAPAAEPGPVDLGSAPEVEDPPADGDYDPTGDPSFGTEAAR